MVDIDHCLVYTLILQLAAYMLDQRAAAHGDKGLRKGVGERAEAGAESRCKYHSFHGVAAFILQISRLPPVARNDRKDGRNEMMGVRDG